MPYFTIRDIRLFVYAKNCLKEISDEPIISEVYSTPNSDGKHNKNIGFTKLGVLYTFVDIPKDLNKKDKTSFLNHHLELLNKSMMVMGLSGIVVMKHRIFHDEDNKQYTYLVKFFAPLVKFSSLVKDLLIIGSISLIVIYLKKQFGIDISNLLF
jgi:hypothetical protein